MARSQNQWWIDLISWFFWHILQEFKRSLTFCSFHLALYNSFFPVIQTRHKLRRSRSRIHNNDTIRLSAFGILYISVHGLWLKFWFSNINKTHDLECLLHEHVDERAIHHNHHGGGGGGVINRYHRIKNVYAKRRWGQWVVKRYHTTKNGYAKIENQTWKFWTKFKRTSMRKNPFRIKILTKKQGTSYGTP